MPEHSPEAIAAYPGGQQVGTAMKRTAFDRGRALGRREKIDWVAFRTEYVPAEVLTSIEALHPADAEWSPPIHGYRDAGIGCPTCRTDGPCPTWLALKGVH